VKGTLILAALCCLEIQGIVLQTFATVKKSRIYFQGKGVTGYFITCNQRVSIYSLMKETVSLFASRSRSAYHSEIITTCTTSDRKAHNDCMKWTKVKSIWYSFSILLLLAYR
jgi:hypothetical protein